MERLISDKITSEELTILDNNSEWLGISKIQLMECAGYSFTMEIIKKYNLDKKTKVVIFSGTGNNGGDGFVIARHLSALDIPVMLLLLGNPDKIRTSEAKVNWDILGNLDHSINTRIINDSGDLAQIKSSITSLGKHILIVDGLLGTGIKGRIREPINSCIKTINQIRKEESERVTIISIDVPSGMDPNTGEVNDLAVKSDLVITFHRAKKGLKSPSEYFKELEIKPIGIPIEATLYVGIGDILPTFKKRKPNSHKGQFGRMLVIGGSKNYSGAPAYSSLAGIHFGCDLVITYVPSIVGDVLRSYSPDMIVRTSPGDWLSIKAYEEISLLIDWADSIVIGPGIGTDEKTEELIGKVLEKAVTLDKSLVIDADAIKLIKRHLDLIKGKKVIVTPHEGELKFLSDVELPPYDELEMRGNIIFEIAKNLDITLLLKGPYDYICNGKQLKINKTGCPEMSIGGTGDVLAGLCASFLTTGNKMFESACSAAFLNGFLGEYCREMIGPRFTAMDMISNINNAILHIQKQ